MIDFDFAAEVLFPTALMFCRRRLKGGTLKKTRHAPAPAENRVGNAEDGAHEERAL